MSYLNKYLKYKKKYLDLKMKGGGEILEKALKAINEYSPKSSFENLPDFLYKSDNNTTRLPKFSSKDLHYFIYKLDDNLHLLDNIEIPYSFSLTKKDEKGGNILYTLTITDMEKNKIETHSISLDMFD